MRTVFYKLMAMAVLITAMLSIISCSKDDETEGPKSPESGDGRVVFRPSVMTKTSYEGMVTEFSDGDEIGVFAVARGENESAELQEKGNYADNVRYKYVAETKSFEPVNAKEAIYNNPVGVLDFYVYYPYKSVVVDARDIPHYVSGNQTAERNFCIADFMSAVCTGYKGGYASLQFKKQTACLEVIVNKRAENGVEAVTLKAANNGSVVSMRGNGVLTIDNPQPIRMFKFEETDTEYHYRAHLPEQVIKEGFYFVDVTLKNGTIKKYNNSTALTLTKGTLVRYDVTLQSRIKVLAANGGNVSVTAPDKTGNVYNDGKSVVAEAKPIPGWLFKNWQENGGSIGTDNPYTFISETNRTITAIFERAFFLIGTNVSYPNGQHPRLGGNGCSVTPGRSYVFETKAQLTASPGNGFSFGGWTDGNSSSQRWETAGPTDNTYTAKFLRNSYTVSGSASPSNGGSVSGGGSVLFGDPASLSASASSGYHFAGWSDGSSSSSMTIGEVNGDMSFTAYFEADPVTPPAPDPAPDPTPDPDPMPDPPVDPDKPIDPDKPKTYSIICDITGQGTVSGTGTGFTNGTYTLTAHPASGWSSSWTTRQVTVSNADVRTSVTFTKEETKKEFWVDCSTDMNQSETYLTVTVSPTAIETVYVTVFFEYEYKTSDGSIGRGSDSYNLQIPAGQSVASISIGIYGKGDYTSASARITRVAGGSLDSDAIYHY